MKRLTLIAATLVLLALVPARATADLLVLQSSGLIEAGSLGGSPIPADTPFTYSATFDSTNDQTTIEDVGLFPAVVVFDIAGFGTFTSAPGAGVNVFLAFAGGFEAGLSDSSPSGFTFALYNTATPPFDADNPTPSVQSDLAGATSGAPLTIPLAGGAGDLVIASRANLSSFGPTATITSAAVPEPSSFTLLGIAAFGSVGLAAARRRQRVGAGRRGDAL